MSETSLFVRLRRPLVAACAGLFLVCIPQMRANAQIKEGFDDRTAVEGPKTRLESLAEMHKVHVSPHLIIFNEQNKTATVTFTNSGPKPILGMVVVLFAYPDWPHGLPADTTIITQFMMNLLPRDSVVLTPGPKDPFAGMWITGLPTTLTLAPHQTQKVTIHINPPANLPNGEYYARVLAMVRPQDQHRAKGAQDVREHFAMPIKGAIQPLRDSLVVFYRKGTLKSGISIIPSDPSNRAKGAAAEFDNVGYGGPDGRDCPRSLWIRLPLHMTGNSHVEGTLTVTYRETKTGNQVPVNKYPLVLYKDAVTHWWTHTCWVPSGTYQAIIRIEPTNKEIPFKPVEYVIPKPFVIQH